MKTGCHIHLSHLNVPAERKRGSAMSAGHGHDHLTEHGRGDSRCGPSLARRARRRAGVAVALTFGYALVEVLGGLWSGSLAL